MLELLLSERVQRRNQLVRFATPSLCDFADETIDFVAEYTEAAHAFAAQCRDPSIGPSKAISTLAQNMASDGYTPAESTRKDREWGAGVIERSLNETLSQDGILDPVRSGERMIINYACLNNRPSLIPQLSVRPSPLRCPILVVHGGLDKAVGPPPFVVVHSLTSLAVSTGTRLSRANSSCDRRTSGTPRHSGWTAFRQRTQCSASPRRRG